MINLLDFNRTHLYLFYLLIIKIKKKNYLKTINILPAYHSLDIHHINLKNKIIYIKNKKKKCAYFIF